MSTLSRYVIKETAAHAAAGLLVVLGVFVVTRLTTLLNDAAVGSLPGDVVLELLALRTVMALPSLLPAVLYTALMVMLALPVVLATGPRVQMGAYIVRGALIGIGFQMFQQTFTSFGLVTALPPLVTVLTPAGVALAAAAILCRRGAS